MYEDFITELNMFPNQQIPFSKNIAKSSVDSLKNFIKGKGANIPKEQFKLTKEYLKYKKELLKKINLILKNTIKGLNKYHNQKTPIPDLAFKNAQTYYELSFNYQNPGIKFSPLEQCKKSLKQIISLLIVGEYYIKRKLEFNSTTKSNIEINDMSLENYLNQMKSSENNPKKSKIISIDRNN